MFKALPKFLMVIALAIPLYLGSVSSVAHADVTEFYQSGFVNNGSGVYYAHQSDSVSFGITVDDIGAGSISVYGCTDFSGCATWGTAGETLDLNSHATTTIDFNSVSPVPFAGTYVAVIVYDTLGGYLAEYNVASNFGGGYVVIPDDPYSLATSSVETVDTVGRLGFNAIILFFIAFVVTIWMFRLLMR